MRLARQLADRILRDHPERGALVLERHPLESGVAVLARMPIDEAAGVLRRLTPSLASQLAASLPPTHAGELIEALDLDHAARIARRLTDAAREAVLVGLSKDRLRSLRSLLAFDEDTAGGLMDPDVLALPAELGVAAALERIRREPSHARYNLYVVDDEQRLVGALNLRELLLAPAEAELADLMTPAPLHLVADADRAQVVSHPGWKEVHSLPVVDDSGRYLGAIRYRTLRDLEEDLLRHATSDTQPARAFGELLALGAAGALDAFAGTGAREEPKDGD
jgi:magnesium transporter